MKSNATSKTTPNPFMMQISFPSDFNWFSPVPQVCPDIAPEKVGLLKTPQETNLSGRVEKQLKKLAYTLEETAVVIGLSERSIRRLIERGLLKKSKATRRIVVSHNEIERFLSETSSAH